MQRLGRRCIVVNQRDADVARSRIAAVRLIAREHMNDPDAKELLHPDLSRWLKK